MFLPFFSSSEGRDFLPLQRARAREKNSGAAVGGDETSHLQRPPRRKEVYIPSVEKYRRIAAWKPRRECNTAGGNLRPTRFMNMHAGQPGRDRAGFVEAALLQLPCDSIDLTGVIPRRKPPRNISSRE